MDPESLSARVATTSQALSAEALAPEGTIDNWDLVIRPRTGWLQLHLGDLWRYRDLIMIFVWRDFVATYKQTVLGPLWFIVQPLLTTLLYSVVFGGVARIPTGGAPPILFYLAGITIWNYFADCINRTSNTFIGNASIFGKVYFPRLCVPVSVVISNLIRFGIQFALFLVFLAIFAMRDSNVHVSASAALIPLLLLLLAGLGLGLGIIVSALTTRYRDLQVLVTFGVQLLMFATPIIYPATFVPEKYRWLTMANPLTPIVETFRSAYLGSGSVAWGALGYSATVTAAILCIGILLFNHVERTFMDTV